jgi:hypothetical protein
VKLVAITNTDVESKPDPDEPKWHGFPFLCPDCNIEVPNPITKFSADGKILSEGLCQQCSEICCVTRTWEWVIGMCHLADVKDEHLLFPLANKLKN